MRFPASGSQQTLKGTEYGWKEGNKRNALETPSEGSPFKQSVNSCVTEQKLHYCSLGNESHLYSTEISLNEVMLRRKVLCLSLGQFEINYHNKIIILLSACSDCLA